ncbi:hypothetical protein TIFTF001_029600 [Ficus carica]|uniref:Uncharacterized protein n=1 Tax=Ficus carica TaxID=3494 RepID=A0AA88DS02_FICCA|nr:hypothetical protein TIFTF001_029600 [Ficus carica]
MRSPCLCVSPGVGIDSGLGSGASNLPCTIEDIASWAQSCAHHSSPREILLQLTQRKIRAVNPAASPAPPPAGPAQDSGRESSCQPSSFSSAVNPAPTPASGPRESSPREYRAKSSATPAPNSSPGNQSSQLDYRLPPRGLPA